MKADVIHDYQRMPEEEAENSEEALNNSGFKHVETIYKEKNIGMDTVYLAIVLYEEDNYA